MKSSEYWQKRFETLQEKELKNADKYIEELTEQYEKAYLSLEEKITKWYTRLAVNNEVSLEEAKKLLNNQELKEFKWTAEEYIEKGIKNGLDDEITKQLENASARVHISKLDAMKMQIQAEIEQLYAKQDKDIAELNEQIYSDMYYKSAYEIQTGLNTAWQVPIIPADLINKVISKPWTTDNLTFSDRIWKNKNELTYTLQIQLTQALIKGDSLTDVINNISKQFNVSRGKASRLVMTESAFFSSAGQKKCFENLSVERYEIVATLDSHTSQICRDLDGKVFKMSEYEVGITAPPFHVYCRSVTAPYFDDNYTERIARDEDGKTYHVPGNMKYNEWYEKYVTKDEDILCGIFNKNNKVKLKDITEQKTVIINNAFKNETIKNIALNTKIKSLKIGGQSSYHKHGNIVLKDKYEDRTAIHEIGHLVDYNNKWLSSNKSFIKAINNDRKYILNNQNIYKELINNNKYYRELSDIIGGMTDNKIVGKYKHDKKYWKKPYKLERETFAQLFTIAGNDDIKQLEVMQEYLPNTFKEFDNLIRRLL